MGDGFTSRWYYDTQLQESDTDMRLATVTSITGGVAVQFDGETTASAKKYKRLASYSSPAVNDRVLLIQISGTYVILGKII